MSGKKKGSGVIIFLAVFGCVFLALGLFTVLAPDRYTAWRRRRQSKAMRLFETRSVADERPATTTQGRVFLLLGAMLLVIAIIRSGPSSWYLPGTLIFTALGLILFAFIIVSSRPLLKTPTAPTSDQLLTVYNRVRTAQGLPEAWDDRTRAEIEAATAQGRTSGVGIEQAPRRGHLFFRWSKIWLIVAVSCGLIAFLGRTVYPLATNYFGYALPGDAFSDLPGHVTYSGHTYTNPTLCDGFAPACARGRYPACYSSNLLRGDGDWPLVQVTGIPSLPGPIRQVYAAANAGQLPGTLYVYAGTYRCYVVYDL